MTNTGEVKEVVKKTPRWDDTEQEKAFLAILEQAKGISERSVPTIINNEGDRYIIALLIRLLETMVHGTPKTAMPTRHNP